MANVKFEDVHEDVQKVLKEHHIPESALFEGSRTDLYIGTNSYMVAREILNGGKWTAMSDMFKPQKGSDMDHFDYGIDIPFANIGKGVREINAKQALKERMGNEDM